MSDVSEISRDQARSLIACDQLGIAHYSAELGCGLRSELLRYAIYTRDTGQKEDIPCDKTRVLRSVRRFIDPLGLNEGGVLVLSDSEVTTELDLRFDLDAMLQYGDVTSLTNGRLVPSPSRMVTHEASNLRLLVSGLPTCALQRPLKELVQCNGRIRLLSNGATQEFLPSCQWADFYPFASWRLDAEAKQLLDSKIKSLVTMPANVPIQFDRYDPNARGRARWYASDLTDLRQDDFNILRTVERITRQVSYYLAFAKYGRVEATEITNAEYRLLVAWSDLKLGKVIQPTYTEVGQFLAITLVRLPPDPILWCLDLFSAYVSRTAKVRQYTFLVPIAAVPLINLVSSPVGIVLPGDTQ